MTLYLSDKFLKICFIRITKAVRPSRLNSLYSNVLFTSIEILGGGGVKQFRFNSFS